MPANAVRQVAALPLRREQHGVAALLITSSAGRWILPKGHLDRGRTAPEMAAVEALEEAGVIGAIGDQPVGRYSYRRSDALHRVEVFPLFVERVLPRWKEQPRRRRLWVPLEEAADRIQIRALADVVRRFAAEPDHVLALGESARRRRIAG